MAWRTSHARAGAAALTVVLAAGCGMGASGGARSLESGSVQPASAHVPLVGESVLSVAVYWGQDSAARGGGEFEKTLSTVCAQGSPYDTILLSRVSSFVHTRNAGGYPELDLATHCATPWDARNRFLLRCDDVAAGILTCHDNGKRVLLSLGGSGGAYGFNSDGEGEAFAQTVWDMFLGGGGTVRPFGRAVLDGVNLDIQGGTTVGYATFVTALRRLASTDSRHRYTLTAAPQCPFPDAYLGPAPGLALGDALGLVDALFVQFYNNPCSYNNRASFATALSRWASLHAGGGPRVFVGLPASPQAAETSGFVGRADLPGLVQGLRRTEGFGGVVLWDASQDAEWAYGSLVRGLLR